MADRDDTTPGAPAADETPGDAPEFRAGLYKNLAGLGLSALLTLASFWAAGTGLVWGPGVPVLLAALAIGQMGVHLVFFLHISSGPEGTNNILALAFGVFIVGLVVFGSMIIMSNLDDMVMPSGTVMYVVP
ncbi:MAG TPA: cytochrome C oxidase subunit IV family protein [Burkholderiaceae bacterium]